jgi:hypothetical protein
LEAATLFRLRIVFAVVVCVRFRGGIRCEAAFSVEALIALDDGAA